METKLLFTKTAAIYCLGLLLTSCSTSIHLSKKRYSDGYYVDIIKNEAPQKGGNAE
ncbi:MAG: hypothetical protein ACKOXB_07975 [Flavobacteriales bacterium]